MLRKEVASGSELGKEIDIKQEMESIVEYSRYLSDTIDNFQNFFKPNSIKYDITPQELISKAIKFTSYAIEINDVECNNRCNSDVYVYVNVNEILQVFINLIKNSIDAFAKKQKDKVINIFNEMNENSFLFVFEDNAGGIDEKIVDKIFDEYFTTKGEKGTGIGLYMSKMIIKKRYKGDILVKNIKNGARFEIKIPNDMLKYENRN
jgi:signal transduction histidine kinase